MSHVSARAGLRPRPALHASREKTLPRDAATPARQSKIVNVYVARFCARRLEATTGPARVEKEDATQGRRGTGSAVEARRSLLCRLVLARQSAGLLVAGLGRGGGVPARGRGRSAHVQILPLTRLCFPPHG
jgi:hypothetical protein